MKFTSNNTTYKMKQIQYELDDKSKLEIETQPLTWIELGDKIASEPLKHKH